ncbi:MAG: hypothetical protein C5B49_01355 [Bdellovibrio sp.]|nr:MAG: hypothetical protein C5B49_01355 [Bdellovibrio sp.]
MATVGGTVAALLVAATLLKRPSPPPPHETQIRAARPPVANNPPQPQPPPPAAPPEIHPPPAPVVHDAYTQMILAGSKFERVFLDSDSQKRWGTMANQYLTNTLGVSKKHAGEAVSLSRDLIFTLSKIKAETHGEKDRMSKMTRLETRVIEQIIELLNGRPNYDQFKAYEARYFNEELAVMEANQGTPPVPSSSAASSSGPPPASATASAAAATSAAAANPPSSSSQKTSRRPSGSQSSPSNSSSRPHKKKSKKSVPKIQEPSSDELFE